MVIPHRSTQCLGRNWRVVAGPEYHRAGVKDPQEPAYGGSFKWATMGQHQFTHPDQVLQVRKWMRTTLPLHLLKKEEKLFQKGPPPSVGALVRISP